jgi:hypothetical protein
MPFDTRLFKATCYFPVRTGVHDGTLAVFFMASVSTYIVTSIVTSIAAFIAATIAASIAASIAVSIYPLQCQSQYLLQYP